MDDLTLEGLYLGIFSLLICLGLMFLVLKCAIKSAIKEVIEELKN